jgi:hypothetical protein
MSCVPLQTLVSTLRICCSLTAMQRVLEGTFQLDMSAARFCAADDRWAAAVEFLDSGDGAGWDLVKVSEMISCACNRTV